MSSLLRADDAVMMTDVRPGDFRVLLRGKHKGKEVRVYNVYDQKSYGVKRVMVELDPTTSIINHGPQIMVRPADLSAEVRRGDLEFRTAFEEGVRAEHEGRACRVPINQFNTSWITQVLLLIEEKYDRP